jgi:hypothetical protein
MENILYFDTDSIFSKKEIINTDFIRIGNDLGEWSLESDEIKDAIFLSPKVYAYKKSNGEEVRKCAE